MIDTCKCRFCVQRKPDPSAVTIWDEERQRNVCGLCGSQDIEPGYGLAGGGGIGTYNFCTSCQRILDKTEEPTP